MAGIFGIFAFRHSRKIMIFILYILPGLWAGCPTLPTNSPKNETWVAQDSDNTTLFIAQGGFRVLTEYKTTTGEQCPFYIDFMRNNSTITANKTNEYDMIWPYITVTIDQSLGVKSNNILTRKILSRFCAFSAILQY